MESLPHVHFARTVDGVSIAYYTLGKGPPLLHLFPHIASHLTLHWRVPTSRAFIQRLAEQMTVIGLDWRGCGLSDAWSGDLTAGMLRSDMLAVLDELHVKQTNICAWGLAANYALDFAAQHPERVSRLVLGEFNRGVSQLRNAIVDLGGLGRPLAAQTLAAIMGGFSKPEDVAALAVVHAKAMDVDARFREMTRTIDLAELLPAVKAPALFVHSSDDSLLPLAEAKTVVADMPHAALHVVPGTSPLAIQGDADAARAISEFLLGQSPDGVREAEVTRLARPGQDNDSRSSIKLSRRQREVLGLIAVGKTNREIAEELVLSLRTVERHLADLYARIGARNRSEAVAFAVSAGLASRN